MNHCSNDQFCNNYVISVALWWLERLACNVESTGSNLVRDNYCVGTLSKFFVQYTVLIASAPLRCVSALLRFLMITYLELVIYFFWSAMNPMIKILMKTILMISIRLYRQIVMNCINNENEMLMLMMVFVIQLLLFLSRADVRSRSVSQLLYLHSGNSNNR